MEGKKGGGLLPKVAFGVSQVALVVKNLPVNFRRPKRLVRIRRSPGGGNGNPLQHSCLGNPMDRGACQATSPWGCKQLDMAEHMSSHSI